MNLAITYEQIEAELLQQGIEQGEERRSRAIARELLRKGMAPDEVAQLTQLTISTVEGLANELLPNLAN
jgi:hypothetical protein